MTIRQLRKAQAKRRGEKRRAKAAPKKALAAWSKEVRKEGKCQICGSTNHVQAHHILPRERYPEHKLNPMNGVALCSNHHKWSKWSAHRNPLFFILWLRRKFPDKYEWAKANVGVDPTARK